MTQSSAQPKIVAKPADWFQNGFHHFLEPYLKRHFHALAVERRRSVATQFREISARTGEPSPLEDPTTPLIVYSNHPSWWEPLTAHYVNRKLFDPCQFYAPIDADALQKYKVFEKLGFFGVDPKSSRGGAQFLRVANEIFQRPHTALWVTPEGRFADVRDHEPDLMPGMAHLCRKLQRAWVVPVAMEYVFWEERLPECLVQFGEMVSVTEFRDRDKQEWSRDLKHRLRDAQRRLAELVIARDSQPFENLMRGKQGTSGIYDFSRRLKAWMTGREFHPGHGRQFSEQ
ncbi:MAG: lysophospholipid acyltransferase family protein [Planctomycetota bacterium]